MGKRETHPSGDDGEQASLKRQKIRHVATSSEDVQSSRQLRQLLAFDPDAGRSKHGIQSFKAFLEGLPEAANLHHYTILKEYLQSQKPEDEEDKTAVFLPDLMQTWSFASQSNNETLLSAVPAVLALLLRSISSILEFSPYAVGIGRTILQKSQIEIVSHGLSANKNKDHLISPCLRLLKEIVTLDGGLLAKQAFRGREHTLKNLARNLGLRYEGDTVEDKRRPSIRTHALRLLLSFLRFLPSDSKKELLNHRDIVASITRDILGDPSYLIAETLGVIKVHVLQDTDLPRDAKVKLMNPYSLQRIATLYNHPEPIEESEPETKPLDTVVHEFLMLACTSSDVGILTRQTGMYPRGVDPDVTTGSGGKKFIDLGLESIGWAKKFTDEVPVRNTILSEFIQKLKPWANLKHSELVIAIFEKAPELIADYFFKNKSFSFDPKVTSTWMGYAAFVFSTVQLPFPAYFGHRDQYARLPPPTSIVIESILPKSVTQKSLSKCLNNNSDLVTFFGIRLLIVAFSKLQDAIRCYREASADSSSVWSQAEKRLLEEFYLRCPPMKDVIASFRNIPETNLMQREAAIKLLAKYYDLAPQLALEEKFDVSSALTKSLLSLNTDKTPSADRALRLLEAEHLFFIAHRSPGMRWFNKAGGLDSSPLTAMLILACEESTDIPLSNLHSLLESVLKENQVLQSYTSASPLDALIVALKKCNGSAKVFEFLENCVLRCTTAPIKYIDALDNIVEETHTKKPRDEALKSCHISLLHLVIEEQWPFVVKAGDQTDISNIATFISYYIAGSLKIEEDKKVLKVLTKRLAEQLPEGNKARKTIERSRKQVDAIEIAPAKSQAPKQTAGKAATTDGQSEKDTEILSFMLQPPTPLDPKALSRWTSKELAEIIEEGHLSSLIMLLSSPDVGTRKEALTNLHKLSLKLKESSYEEKEQIWLLLCELCETARPHIPQKPLPSNISAFAAHAALALKDPLHCLYPKINKFLTQGPTWDIDRFPLMHAVLSEPPSLDDAHYQEMDWLVGYLLAGLRTEDDMGVFHKRRVFERILTAHENPYLRKGLRDKILRILFRATTIVGGSTTLITRFSVLSWTKAQFARHKDPALKLLWEQVLKTCDEERVGKWAGMSVEELGKTLELEVKV